MSYLPNPDRYSAMRYRRSGNSGLLLPELSLGLWHNFGETDSFAVARDMVRFAFDSGITHFDLANNYGTPPGSAEETLGRILKKDFEGLRHEMVITTKAGHLMWPGPYGDWGSRKYIIESCNDSLKRMGLEYVDIFYTHRYDPNTPLEETASALETIYRQGKALYIGISKYPAAAADVVVRYLREARVPVIIHQLKYSMLVREPEKEVLGYNKENGLGTITFSPLAQGLLTDKYIDGIPEDSRAAKAEGFLKKEEVAPKMNEVKALREIASRRGQTIAQMALSWLLHDNRVTSVLIGASRVQQIAENLKALENITFSKEELEAIDRITLG
jgi:L-glyceraldehyde 3-phosphate reductase